MSGRTGIESFEQKLKNFWNELLIDLGFRKAPAPAPTPKKKAVRKAPVAKTKKNR